MQLFRNLSSLCCSRGLSTPRLGQDQEKKCLKGCPVKARETLVCPGRGAGRIVAPRSASLPAEHNRTPKWLSKALLMTSLYAKRPPKRSPSLPFSLSLSLSLLFEKKNFFIPAFDIRRNTTFPEISELARVGRFNSVVGIGINILLL